MHAGVYGDQLNEAAWMVGELKSLLQQLQLDKNTLVMFLSDNGPHVELCGEGGSTGMLRVK